MMQLGAGLLLFGIGTFLLPMIGMQFNVLDLFGPNSQPLVGVAAIGLGILFLIAGKRAEAIVAKQSAAANPGARPAPPQPPEHSGIEPAAANVSRAATEGLPADFKRTEDEFLRLKGLFDLHRISEAQFKAALHNLMVDYEGQTWMIGQNTGKWYVHDGKDWIEAMPPTGSTPAAASAPAQAAIAAGGQQLPAPAKGRHFPWWLRIIALAILGYIIVQIVK